MKTILALDIDKTQEKLLKEMLRAMNIFFRNYSIEERELTSPWSASLPTIRA